MHPSLVNSLLLRGLKLLKAGFKTKKGYWRFWVKKKSTFEFCPHCATRSSSIYDHREVSVKDEAIRDRPVFLVIRKRRFWCKPCKKVFTEAVHGIKKGRRTTNRFRDSVFNMCERFGDLKMVRRIARCSSSFLYSNYYHQITQRITADKRHWPKVLGIDEHFFKRNRQGGYREFVSIFVDINKSRILDLVEGKRAAILSNALADVPGREKVKLVSMDLCETYRNFTRSFFTNATIVADKFHVIRLLNGAINQYRKRSTGDNRKLPARKLLLANGRKLSHATRVTIGKWLRKHQELSEVYYFKEKLHSLYRQAGFKRAKEAFIKMCDDMATSTLSEVRTLRRTLLRWQNEILAYFNHRITNAKTEGFNNKAKLIKRRAYGYRSFKNYRLRLLAATR